VVPPPGDPNLQRRRIRIRRAGLIAVPLALAAVTIALVQLASTDADSPPAPDPPAAATASGQRGPKPSPQPPAHPKTRPGSDPSVLPGNVLIADKANNRLLEVDPNGHIVWRFPRPGDLAPGQTFQVPDDAFYTPNGGSIVATQEDDFAISAIDVARHRISYRYGVPGVPGSSANHVYNPDDAMMLPGGQIFTADIKNCRLLVLQPPSHTPVRQIGATGGCIHDPPQDFGSPNGAFPTSNGDTIVTEISGDWVDVLSPSGRLLHAVHAPGFTYPSDTNELRSGVFLSVDYTTPGAIETFNYRGRLLWRYAPKGKNALDHPSLAIPLPNGDILANDDSNDRVIVVDPKTNRIVWQYGHTGQPGTRAGFLNIPDGVDLAPPNSLIDGFPQSRAPR
jgi:DNA-binding beta-propeller fold protein YncE